MRRRLLFIGALTCLTLMIAAAPAAAKGGGGGSHDRRISLSGALVVADGEVVNGPVVSIDGPATITGRVNNDVFVGHGNLTISGRVTGDVLVVDGDATITGRVDGDITGLHGQVLVKAGASVHGDITSSKAPRAASGTVRGHVKSLDLRSIFTGLIIGFLIVLWGVVTISIGILGFLFIVLFPRGADSAVVAGRRVGASIGVGLLVGILGPILGVAIVSTGIGVPLGASFLGTMTVLITVGYVSSALILGRLMVKSRGTGARVGAFFAGFAILRLAALIPALGFVFWYGACFYGIGALTIAAWRAAHRDRPARVRSARPSTVATAVGERPPQPEPGAAPPVRRPPTRARRAAATTSRRPPAKAAAKKPAARRAPAKKAPKATPARPATRPKKAPAKKRAGRAKATTSRSAPAKKAAVRPRAAKRKASPRVASPRRKTGTAVRARR